MDLAYSLSLLLSLIAGGLGATIFALVSTQPNRARKIGPKIALAALVCGTTALLCGVISVVIHLVFGHGPDSDAPMTTWQFLRHHNAYWLVLIFIFLAYSGWRSAKRY